MYLIKNKNQAQPKKNIYTNKIPKYKTIPELNKKEIKKGIND